ncbi:MAG: extracellular solute-binding protein [Verrucomicrobiales bacterium]|nr:extracellular solute-binding protein [Verrucomicrobiales bacterium]
MRFYRVLAAGLMMVTALSCARMDELESYDSAPEIEAFYKKEKDFFTFANPADVPEGLQWQDGMDQPEVGDDQAKKGGVLNQAIQAFPPTYRTFGPNSNHSFRGEFHDNIEMGLVSLHPDTMQVIPGLAKQWAVSKDRQTVYFRLDPEARYSDGVPVVADDYLMTFYVYRSPYANAPFYSQYYGTQYKNITKYDDLTISITLATAKPKTAYFAALSPMPRHFLKEFGPDYPVRYQWRVKPTTGAYQIDEDKTRKGRVIVLKRVKDWWAKDRRYQKNRFNPDYIRYRLVRNSEKQFELFRNGEMDLYSLNAPRFWNEKTEMDVVYKGYIKKAIFYNDYPRVPRGLYINNSKPLLDDVNVRVGMQHASNMQKLIDFDFRGDYRRTNIFCEGYGKFSEPNIRAREFDPKKAREFFAKAGFTQSGKDGILKKKDGTRLSFAISVAQDPQTNRIVLRLKEEAAKAGLEYQIESLDGTGFFKKVMSKQHEICFWGWGAGPPYPRYYQNFFSGNAYEQGSKTPKPNTNNITVTVDPRLDEYSLAIRNATTEQEIQENAYATEKVIHELAPWVPGYHRNYYRFGYWRWLKFPEKSFNVRVSSEPYEAHVHWVDMKVKEETLTAKRKGEVFPESLEVYDQYLVK